MPDSNKNSNKIRLCRTEVNIVLNNILATFDASLESKLKDQRSKPLKHYHEIKREQKKIFVFPMCKDARTQTNNVTIPYFADVVKNFFNKHPDEKDCTMLIPMAMCRGVFKAKYDWEIFGMMPLKWLQRAHAVLLELKISDDTIYPQVHDPQSTIIQSWYPDKLTELTTLAGKKISYNNKDNYHAYGTQEDYDSCTYHVLEMIRDILKSNGDTKNIQNIKVSITSKNDYFKNNQIPTDEAEQENLTSTKIETFDDDFNFLSSSPCRMFATATRSSSDEINKSCGLKVRSS